MEKKQKKSEKAVKKQEIKKQEIKSNPINNVNNNKNLNGQKQLIIRQPSRITTHGILREGQSLEEFLRKAMAGNEPIQATAKVTYNDRKDGVLPQHDIRTDRFELAQEQTTKYHKTRAAQQLGQDFPEQYNPDGTLKAAKSQETPKGEA